MITWQNELQHSTGEIEPNFPRSCVMDGSDCGHNSCPIAEPESDAEMGLCVTGPTFAESQQRLASAIDARTGNWLEHQRHHQPSPNCHLCKEWAGWRAKEKS